MSADQVLVGRNNPRRAYNMRVRQKQNIEDPLPVAGDKLVCLRNNRKKGLFNGGLWRGEKRKQTRSKKRPPRPRAVPGAGNGFQGEKGSRCTRFLLGGLPAGPPGEG